MHAAGGEPTYTISDLAREFALTTRAIRFYEDRGLLAPRRAGNRRTFGEKERVRIKLIIRGTRLGLSLAEVKELFDLYEATQSEDEQLRRFLPLLARRRAELEQRREDIAVVLAEIDQLERQCCRLLATGSANGGADDAEEDARVDGVGKGVRIGEASGTGEA